MKNKVKLLVKGTNVRRFINLCTQNGICCYDINMISRETYECWINLRDIRQIPQYVRKTQVSFKITGKPKSYIIYNHFKKRVILMISGILMVAFFCNMSNRICIIRINGHDEQLKTQISQTLQKKHIRPGSYISQVNCQNLEEELKNTFKTISWLTVAREGVILEVDFQKNRYCSTTQKDSNSKRQILANKTCIIHSIVTRSGSPCVAAGDKVQKGSVLVDNIVAITNDNDEKVDYLKVDADAEIVAQTEYIFNPKAEGASYDLNILINELKSKRATILSIDYDRGKIKVYENIGVKK